MKIRVMYGESFVTYCGYEDYIVDLDKFPELQGKSEEEITKWLYDNSEKLSVDFTYEDNNPRGEMGKASEIIPYDPEATVLLHDLGSNGVTWDKIKNEEHYFVYIREEKNEEDEVSS